MNPDEKALFLNNMTTNVSQNFSGLLFYVILIMMGERISFAIMEPVSLEETQTKCAPPILQVGSSTGTALHTLKLPPVPLLHNRSKAWSPPRGEVASMCQPQATSDWWSI